MANEIEYSIIKHVAVLARYQTGWCKELNIVKWNNGEPKYDIRDWSPDHDHMTKGITLYPDELRRLVDFMKDKEISIPSVNDARENASKEDVEAER